MASCSDPRQDSSIPSTILAHAPAPVVALPAHSEDAIDSTLVADVSTPMTESPAPAPELVDAIESTSPIDASTQGMNVFGTVAGVRNPSKVSTSSHEGDSCGLYTHLHYKKFLFL
ncbi:hypothetical protein V6N11_058510 [Hibiscus sabdariffa]|uniref:Uncharacterized protein n=1 Tax=Hibiscus sabdariffa TaxID=183260 RepID=A0ABR2U4G7_9ROSI